jgi:hypothetical protein
VTDSRLGDLMHELVADVGGPPMARIAWARSVRIRRRRRSLAAAASGMLVAGLAFVLVGGLAPDAPTPKVAVSGTTPPVSPAPLAAAPGEPRIQQGPARDKVGALPALRSPLAELSRVPTTAAALTDSPLPKAVAAVQRGAGPVLVLGPGNDWRAVPGGGLTSDTISPDGRRLALQSSDGVRVVDVTTGAVRFLPVPRSVTSRIDTVRWLADGKHLAVGGDAGSALLSVADGKVSPLDGLAHEIAVGQSDDPLVLVTRSVLVSRSEDGRETRREYGTGNDVELNMWDGTARQSGGRVAQTAFLRRDDTQAVAVIDLADGRVTDLLTLEFGSPEATRSYGCCETLGWADEQTVLLRDGGSVLAWRPAAGKLYLVAQLPGTAARGSDPGQNISVAIAPPRR